MFSLLVSGQSFSMPVVIGVLMVSGVWTAFVSWIQSELVQDFVPVI